MLHERRGRTYSCAPCECHQVNSKIEGCDEGYDHADDTVEGDGGPDTAEGDGGPDTAEGDRGNGVDTR